jgi:hypothetical protein
MQPKTLAMVALKCEDWAVKHRENK